MYSNEPQSSTNDIKAKAVNTVPTKASKAPALSLEDNRVKSIQMKSRPGNNSVVPDHSVAVQKKGNNTGLPDNLKSGIENLSGHSMDDVKVHYRSDKPAQLQAHAFAQGNQIHIAPGQEKHLPHEAWHVVQQKQGRVMPTLQMKGKVNVNDNKDLEREADTMGEIAQRYFKPVQWSSNKMEYPVSLKSVLQRVIIDDKTVSPAVLNAFNGLNPWVRAMFIIMPEIPGFLEMSDKKKILYFNGMRMVMPMLERMTQSQAGVLMIGHETSAPDENMLRFFELNPNFINESLSLFNGGGASLNFYNPKGPVKLSITSLSALMQPPKLSQIGPPGASSINTALLPAKSKPKARSSSAEEELAFFRATDRQDETITKPLLIEVLTKAGFIIRGGEDFRELEIMHASYLYQRDKSSLGQKPSMKEYSKDYRGAGASPIDKMRKAQIAGPLKGIDEVLAPLVPQLVQLSNLIRLTNYFDSKSERSIIRSGRLQSKERRRMKAPGEHVVSKSSVTDNELGNTDHVFLFAEFVGSKFRKTRFSGTASEENTVLSERQGLDGTERRVSFPLNSIDPRGMHGYVEDIGSKGVNPLEKVFSGTPFVAQSEVHHGGPAEHKDRKESKALSIKSIMRGAGSMTAASATASGPTTTTVSHPSHHSIGMPTPGVHLLMDLLRLRFKHKNFPGKKNPKQMVENLLSMKKDPLALYIFLFRKHPDFIKRDLEQIRKIREEDGLESDIKAIMNKDAINPQILVPGSVPFSTPGARVEKPTEGEIAASRET